MKRFTDSNRVLVIAPHCGDETYGMGGTLLKFRERGIEVLCVVVVCGDLFLEHPGTTITRAERVLEFEAAKSKLGVDGVVLPFTEETRLDRVPIGKVIAALEQVQDEFQADHWYIINPSAHQDDRIVFEAAMAATRPTRKTCPYQVFRYELPTYSSNTKEWAFTPQIYEDIGPYLETKLEACAYYKSQVRPQGILSLEATRRFAEVRGFESRNQAAECYEVIRIIK
jgi:LmbE family N-acetylglucosaminyl deacetylase